MNNEQDQKPEENSVSSGNKQESESFLSEKEEFQLLLKGIEENSKHARSVMFALVLACVYVVLTAYTSTFGVEGTPGSIELPILKIEVKAPQFFFFSPLVILIAYLYLHIYIRELNGRLKSVRPYLSKFGNTKFDPNHLLFPWIVVFAFQARATNDQSHQGKGKEGHDNVPDKDPIAGKNLLIRAIANILVWLLGPVVLFFLWALFVGERDAVSFIPCLSFILAVYTARYTAFHRLARSSSIIFVVLAIVFIVFTISSVPDLSTMFGLNTFWTSVNDFWTEINDSSSARRSFFVIIGIQILPVIIWVTLLSLGEKSLRIRLRYKTVFKRLRWLHLLFSLSNFIFTNIFNKFRVLSGIPNRITGDILKGHNLSWSNLRGVDFSDADLRGTDFYDANLSGANLSGAKLALAWLMEADLSGANLTNTDLSNAHTYFAKYSSATRFPEGYHISENMVFVDSKEESDNNK